LLATLYGCEFDRERFLVLRPVALEIAEKTIPNSTLWATQAADIEALPREKN
jgi:hypothetical protein